MSDGPLHGCPGVTCQFSFGGSMRCELPAWDEAPEDEPRCPFHSEATPADIKQRLEEAVSSGASFLEAKLAGTYLERVDIPHARLGCATLTGADLSSANLREADLSFADLTGARLTGAYLPRAVLQHATLSRARLSGAILWGATLAHADLSDATLSQADCSGAYLGHADLSGARLFRADLRAAHLSWARCGVLWRVQREPAGPERTSGRQMRPTLREADLRGTRMVGMTIAPETNLEGAKFGRCPLAPPEDIIADELRADRPLERRPTYHACAEVYRQLKLAFQASGDYARAGNFFVGEMRCLRKQMVRDGGQYLKRAWWYVLEKVAGYGEQPWRVAVAAAATVLIFAFLHGWLGIDQSLGAHVRPVAGPGLAWPTEDSLKAFGTALYFSAVTFTTLGYGDLQPATGWGRLCSGIEALAGMALMALFLVCIVRKFSR